MPPETGPARRELGILGVRWMVEQKIEENEEMMKEEAIRDGVKRGVFRDGNGPNETLDLGKHTGKTFREVYLKDPSYCSWTVRHDKPVAMKLWCFK